MKQGCFLQKSYGSRQWNKSIPILTSIYQICNIAGCACARNTGNVFPRHWRQRKPLVSDPDMHHGTCVTHVPWCMSGSLTRGGGENISGIPGACATRKFTYQVGGPLGSVLAHLQLTTRDFWSQCNWWISTDTQFATTGVIATQKSA